MLDDSIKEIIKKLNPNWLQTFDHSYIILLIGGSESGKTKSLFNLISQLPETDKIRLYANDPYQVRYQFVINKAEDTGLKRFHDFKAFIEYSNVTMIFIRILTILY